MKIHQKWTSNLAIFLVLCFLPLKAPLVLLSVHFFFLCNWRKRLSFPIMYNSMYSFINMTTDGKQSYSLRELLKDNFVYPRRGQCLCLSTLIFQKIIAFIFKERSDLPVICWDRGWFMFWGNKYRMRRIDSTAISVRTYYVLYSCCWASKDEEFCISEMGLNVLLQVLSNGKVLCIC